MPEDAKSIAYLERVLTAPEGLQEFQHRSSIIYTSIPSECLTDERLPDFIASLATKRGSALSQLIAGAGSTQGTCFYGGWIDQALFITNSQLRGSADGVRSLLPLLSSQPIDQNGDTVLGFVPHDAGFISLIYVSRETRFVYMCHYCHSPPVQANLRI